MSGFEDENHLRAMAAKARRLAFALTDRVTIDRLTKYAEECEAQVERLKSTRQIAVDLD